MDVPEVRRRLRLAIEAARRQAQERRTRADEAARDFEAFLRERATPVFQTFAAALAAEGYRFRIFTPAESLRLASDTSPEDFIEVALDATADPPVVVGRTSRGRGRRLLASERPLREGTAITQLAEEDVLDFLAAEIVPFVER